MNDQIGYLNHDFRTCLAELMEDGVVVRPRDAETKEFLNYNISLFEPRNRIISFADRNTNHKYLLGELIWYLSGNDDPIGILPYSKFWDKIRNADGTVNSNYGTRLFGHDRRMNVNANRQRSLDGVSQWQNVKDILTADKDSRQAIANIHMPFDRVPENKDVPCTLTLQFFIRENELHLIVNMRSNDIILGFTNDVFQFTMLQEIMLLEMQEIYHDLTLGHYYHNAGSMHIYDRHYEMASKIIKDELDEEIVMVPMDAYNREIRDALIELELQFSDGEIKPDLDFSQFKEWGKLTPYWQNLVRFCFNGDASVIPDLFINDEETLDEPIHTITF